jgi:hypothetical protein
MTSCVVINPSLIHRNTASNATTVKGSIKNKSENQSSNSGFLEINTQLKPLLIKEYENKIAHHSSNHLHIQIFVVFQNFYNLLQYVLVFVL